MDIIFNTKHVYIIYYYALNALYLSVTLMWFSKTIFLVCLLSDSHSESLLT